MKLNLALSRWERAGERVAGSARIRQEDNLSALTERKENRNRSRGIVAEEQHDASVIS